MKRCLLLIMLWLPILTITKTSACAAPFTDNQETLLTLDVVGISNGFPDQIEAILFAQKSSTSAPNAQHAVNVMIDKALTESRKVKDVTVNTGNYHVYQNNNFSQDKHKTNIWVSYQEIHIQGADDAVLLELAGKLQEQGLVMRTLQWKFSPSLHDKLQEQAESNGLKILQIRSKKIASILNMDINSFKSIEIRNENLLQPRLLTTAATSPNNLVVPSATRDQQDIRVSISASVRLTPLRH